MITDTLEKIIQGKGIRVGFMEGADPRVLEASYYLKAFPYILQNPIFLFEWIPYVKQVDQVL